MNGEREERFLELLGDLDDRFVEMALPYAAKTGRTDVTRVTFETPEPPDKKARRRYMIFSAVKYTAAAAVLLFCGVFLWEWYGAAVRDAELVQPPAVSETADSEPSEGYGLPGNFGLNESAVTDKSPLSFTFDSFYRSGEENVAVFKLTNISEEPVSGINEVISERFADSGAAGLTAYYPDGAVRIAVADSGTLIWEEAEQFSGFFSATDSPDGTDSGSGEFTDTLAPGESVILEVRGLEMREVFR